MKTRLLSAVLLGSVLCMGLPPLVALTDQSGNSFTHDMKKAGHETKEAGKDTGKGVVHGSKKVWHKTTHGTKHVTHKAAHKTGEGAKHVERKTQTQPQ